MLLLIIIILIIIGVVIYNRNPNVIAKKEAVRQKQKEEFELAEKIIAESGQAAALADYFVEEQFSNPDSSFINFLKLPGAFMKLEVNAQMVRFYLNGVNDSVYETLPTDIPLNLEGYKCYYFPFSSFNAQDLPNSAMVSAFYAYLHKRLTGIEFLDVNDNFIELDRKKYYTWSQSKNTSWSVMPM